MTTGARWYGVVRHRWFAVLVMSLAELSQVSMYRTQAQVPYVPYPGSNARGRLRLSSVPYPGSSTFRTVPRLKCTRWLRLALTRQVGRTRTAASSCSTDGALSDSLWRQVGLIAPTVAPGEAIANFPIPLVLAADAQVCQSDCLRRLRPDWLCSLGSLPRRQVG